MKKYKLYALFVICLIIIFSSLSCGGGGGGGGSSSSPAPAPTPTPTPTPADKGAVITITMGNGSVVAVFAGVADYPESVYDLNYTANDAIDLRDSLVGSALWNGAVVSTQDNIQVTKAMIQNAVTAAKNSTANDGLFIFMYSGHGSHSGNTGYLMPYDSIDDATKRISEDELKSWIDEFPAGSKKYILLDCCYSGLFIDKSLELYLGLKQKTIPIKDSNNFYSADKFAKSLVGAQNTYAMTASSGTELSYESAALQNSIFIYYVIQGLGSGATIGPADIAPTDGTITAEKLTVYVPPLVTAFKPGQNPQSYDNYEDNMRVK